MVWVEATEVVYVINQRVAIYTIIAVSGLFIGFGIYWSIDGWSSHRSIRIAEWTLFVTSLALVLASAQALGSVESAVRSAAGLDCVDVEVVGPGMVR